MTARITPQAWKPGQSGNPKGRPRGVANAATLRKKLGADLDAILQKLVDLAKAGDVQAARAILERCIPALKPAEMAVAIAMPEGGSLVARGEAVIAAAAAGDLAPSQASQLLLGLGAFARLVETEELERRIAALEEGSKGPAV